MSINRHARQYRPIANAAQSPSIAFGAGLAAPNLLCGPDHDLTFAQATL
jgi:hypothetical protein